MIEVEQLAKAFSAGRGRKATTVQAVAGVDFSALDGKITGLLGPNGAGKTTTLRIVAGLIVPQAGQVRVDGLDVVAAPAAARARMGVLSDARGLYPRLTARENIVYYGRLHGMAAAAANARAEALAAMLEMRALLDRRSAGFSQGERMKTALARALVHDPQHHSRRADEWSGRAGDAFIARRAAPAARRRQMHRLFDPHHAGSATPVRSSRRHLAWAHGGPRHHRRAGSANGRTRLRRDFRPAGVQR